MGVLPGGGLDIIREQVTRIASQGGGTPIDRRRPAPDVWEVTRLLPADRIGPQYHIRADSDALERSVHEDQLTLALSGR